MLTGGKWCGYWETDGESCPDFHAASVEDQEYALTLAWRTLRLLTAGMVGSCDALIRPCVASPCSDCVSTFIAPRLHGGEWVNVPCDRRASCSCGPLSEVVLPGKVSAVTSVVIDGVPLVGGYRLDGNRLVRLGDTAWPSCQDMRASVSEPGSFAVTYIPGERQDAASRRAAGILACEFVKACTTGKCRLPSSVTTIARQGVTMEFDNSMFSNGLTGIREVDVFVLTVNPNRNRATAKVWSPDAAGHRVG